uniref:ACT domain-containing protein ACR n=1 Tax=Oryza glumipatula TaxID=40148 RepID=A0A0D9YXR9_9ORYZ
MRCDLPASSSLAPARPRPPGCNAIFSTRPWSPVAQVAHRGRRWPWSPSVPPPSGSCRSCRSAGLPRSRRPVAPAAPAAPPLPPLRRAPAVSPPSGSCRPRRPAAPTAPPGSRGLAAPSFPPLPPSRRSRHLVGWEVVHPFMDVFHVTDRLGCKLTNDSVITYIEQSLGMWNGPTRPMALEGLTALELTGAGRTGLISEVFAVLADMDCGVVEGRAWMHRVHLGCLIFLRDEETDTERMARIEAASDTSAATPSAPAAAPWPPSPPPPSRTPSAPSTLDKTTSETTGGGDLLWFLEKKEVLYPVFRLRDVIHTSAGDEGGKMDLFLTNGIVD